MDNYYPSAKIRLIIRLDEFGQTSKLAPAPMKSAKNLDGASPPRGPLVAVPDPNAPPGIRSFLITTPGSTQAQSATSQSRSGDGLTFDITVIPKDVTWSRNGARCAGTAKASFKYIDAPLHPMCIRAVAVEIFMGGVPAADYASGIAGELVGTTSGLQSLAIIPDTYIDLQGRQRTNSRFKGWVDTWEMDWSEDGEPLINIQCRDNLSLLIDTPAPVKLVLDAQGTTSAPRVSASLPIDQAIAKYLATFPQMQGLSVQWLDAEDPPTLDNVMTNSRNRPQLGPQPAQGAGATAGGTTKLSVLDYITELCGYLAVNIRMAGDVIILQRPRSAMANTAPSRVDDPFTGRTLPNGGFAAYRQFIYGRNLKSMKFTRNYVKKKPQCVEVKSYNPGQKFPLTVRFPLVTDRTDSKGNLIPNLAIPGNAQPDQQWETIKVTGITDKKLLRQIAQAHYEQVGRNEMQVEVETKNLGSFGADSIDADILDMDFGDRFEVLINRIDDNSNTVNRIEKLLDFQAKNSQYMQALGFPADFADAYANAYTNAGFLPQYVCKQVHVSFSQEEGMTLQVVGVNYIEVRADESLADGEEPAAAAAPAGGIPISSPF